MLSKEKTKLLKDIISTMDSFQQNYGKCHYNVKIRYESEGKKVPKQVETKLVDNWNEINVILRKEEELLNY